ncbi:MAG: hypothetical protein ACI81L_000485 [Verrucomicrobiales bacterium]|jgi:hypothetical protein
MNDDMPTNNLKTDDDEAQKLFAEFAMPAERQIILLGLIVAALAFFGSTLWDYLPI